MHLRDNTNSTEIKLQSIIFLTKPDPKVMFRISTSKQLTELTKYSICLWTPVWGLPDRLIPLLILSRTRNIWPRQLLPSINHPVSGWSTRRNWRSGWWARCRWGMWPSARRSVGALSIRSTRGGRSSSRRARSRPGSATSTTTTSEMARVPKIQSDPRPITLSCSWRPSPTTDIFLFNHRQ